MTLPVLGLAGAYTILLVILVGNLRYLKNLKERPTSPLPETSVSVLIPARNEEQNLARLLPTLLGQSCDHLEIIVYDDQSDDGTAAVARGTDDSRVEYLAGSALPDGWLGKPHALHNAARKASGEWLVFLDADVRLLHNNVLENWISLACALPEFSYLSGMPRIAGNGKLLTSLVPFSIFSCLPLFLMRRFSFASLSILNGPVWMIRRHDYQNLQPHRQARNAILEDVETGRYLKRMGMTPWFLDLRSDAEVRLYENFGSAWRGFRKNVYLLMSGSFLGFFFLFLLWFLVFSIGWTVFWPLLFFLMLVKGISDRFFGFPVWVTLLSALTFPIATILQLDSAAHHLTGNVSWKGRKVN